MHLLLCRYPASGPFGRDASAIATANVATPAHCRHQASAASIDSACSKACCCAPNRAAGSDTSRTSRCGPSRDSGRAPVLDPLLHLPRAPVATPQPLLPTVPAPALPYPAATQPQPATTAQVMVLHGVMPLPQKLLTRITALEFVEIQELLPEAWLLAGEMEHSGCCSSTGAKKRRPPVTNIFTWLQGFASLVSALSTRYPAYVPEFLAYQSTIIKCYREYDGLGWAQYDRAFRRQVAVTKSLHWSHINGSLCFAGKGRRSAVCVHCLSYNHVSEHCPDAPATTSKLREDRRVPIMSCVGYSMPMVDLAVDTRRASMLTGALLAGRTTLVQRAGRLSRGNRGGRSVFTPPRSDSHRAHDRHSCKQPCLCIQTLD